ncbi:BTB/POZ domain-containing protein 16 [Amblyraja radiata]|uniref:BTB/POZ domain-containing protein 16 n=1 Tax=Amblyraja radiata TaxID=386614 RepID=UPI00140222AF|nr:BTB/POZ domain-containing protein 16 [Amblyraja radiata]
MPFTVKTQDSLIFSYQEAPLPNTLSTSPFNVSLTNKVRTQAGITNRCQAKEDLGSDLLGRAQATKAVQMCFNETLQRILTGSRTYVVLESMDTLWELHSHFLSKSERLHELINTSDQSEYCRNKSPKTADICQAAGLYHCGRKDTCESKCDKLMKCNLCSIHNKENRWATTQIKTLKRMISLKLDVKDPHVTKEGFSIALGNLYNDKPEVEAEHILGVFAAAGVLKFRTLFKKCAIVMLENINTATVCHFHQVAMKYNQDRLKRACERWLELNLIVHLRYEVTLRDLNMEVLRNILLSPRLFTFTEYHVLQTILSWIFLQVNTEIRLMPLYSTIVAYFISLQNMVVYLEKEIRQKYFGLFQTVRLHGITETQQIEELQKTNLLPQTILLQVVTHNYYALQHGGDMPRAKYFPSEAIRFGFMLTEEPRYWSEIISYCGFYFELKAIQEKKGPSYSFFMQRLNHADTNLPYGITERKAFSLRQERELKYEIMVQTMIDEEWQVFTTGYSRQKFGITKKSCQSEVLLVSGLTMPVYVTFALLFPVS